MVILSIPALSLLFLQNREVQTRLSQFLAGRLSEELEASISLSSVSYSFFRRMQVRDLYIEDLNGDTLIYAGLTKLRIKNFRPEPKGLIIRKITVEDALVNLVIDSTGLVNIKYFTDMMKNPHVPPEMKSRVLIEDIDLVDTRFSLTRTGHTHSENPIDFNDFHLYQIRADVKNLEVYMDTVFMEVASLECVERSGFDFGRIQTQLSINRHFLHFDQLNVRTAGSDLNIPRLWFDFEAFNRFKRFSSAVDLAFESRDSKLLMDDLSQFVSQTGSVLQRLKIDGRVTGKLSDLNGEDLSITFDEQSTLAFDFRMFGLPDIRNTFMDFNFRELNTSVVAVNDLLNSVFEEQRTELSPWDNLGNLDFTGQFTGYPDEFVASGLLATDMGRMLLDLSFDPDSLRGVGFDGRIRSSNFMLGKFLSQEDKLNQLDMDVLASGNLYKGQIEANLKGTIDTLELFNYAYSNITLDGSVTNETFEGGFRIMDPNISLEFEGRTDFSGEIPVHRFTADVARVRPYYLNLPQSDPAYFASFLVETDLSGRTLDELNGEIKLVNSLFEKTDAQVQLYNVNLTARNTPDASLLQLRSDLVDADIMGVYRLSSLPGSFRNLADHYLNVVAHTQPYTDSANYFTYTIDIKRINPLMEFFLPGISIGDRSFLSGTYDPLNKNVIVEADFPYLGIGGNQWHGVRLDTRSEVDEILARIRADSMMYADAFSLVDQEVDILATNDTAFVEVRWDNHMHPNYSGMLSMHGTFEHDTMTDRGFLVGLDPGSIILNDIPWDIYPASMRLKKGYTSIKGFEASSQDKHIMADGVISRQEGRDFLIEAENLNLAEVPDITGANMKLAGNLTGYVNYSRRDGAPVLLSRLNVDSLYFNDEFLGHTELDAQWNEDSRSIGLTMISRVNDRTEMEASGEYSPRSGVVDFEINLNGFDLEALNPYTKKIARDLDGEAIVRLTLDGTLEKPDLNGSIAFEGGTATIGYLNTPYSFNDRIRIYHNNIYLESFVVNDTKGNIARVSGSVANTYLKDFFINLNIEASNIQCMNTRSTDNEVFYGNVFATGNVRINGEPDNIRMDIRANTEENTALYLPLYNASEVQTTDFITFVREKEFQPIEIQPQSRSIRGVTLDLEVDVNTNAVVQLIFDPKVGDIIETRGNGNLRMTLDPAQGFRMLGDITLDQGDYLFTLQNVINKRFEIEPGGTIRFNGSPLDASVDLEAVYNLRAAPYNLYPDVDDTKESLKRRIPVECHMILLGELGAPTISTGISLPTADAETRNLLENATSTDEDLMKQFLSLLVINNFYSVAGYGTQDIGTTGNFAGVTASELLSNQLSNWLSQISDDFDIGVNYRPGDEITSDEVEVALSTQLLNDRVIISGNVDVGGQNPSEGDNPNIMGDFDVEFRVTDNISIIAFNRARDELLFETAPYKQGVGISYREEFDDLNQLVNRYKEGIANRRKKKRNLEEPDPKE